MVFTFWWTLIVTSFLKMMADMQENEKGVQYYYDDNIFPLYTLEEHERNLQPGID